MPIKFQRTAMALLALAAAVRVLELAWPTTALTLASDALTILGTAAVAASTTPYAAGRRSMRWQPGAAWLGAFVAAAAASIALHRPHPAFHAWQQLAVFAAMLMAIGPVVGSPALQRARNIMWHTLMWSIRAAIALAWVAYIIEETTDGPQPSWFGSHIVLENKMRLSAAAGIATIDTLRLTLQARKPVPWAIGTAICLLTTITAGSRIALLGLATAIPILLIANSHETRRKAGPLLLIAAIALITIAFAHPYVLRPFTRKFEIAQAHGSPWIYSRQALWADRWAEFNSSPFSGIGFHAYARSTCPTAPEGWTPAMGPLEPGSSWLTLLSQTGIAGTAMLLVWLAQWLTRLIRHRQSYLLAVAAYCLVNGITEGWLTYSGSVMFMIFWLNASRSAPFAPYKDGSRRAEG